MPALCSTLLIAKCADQYAGIIGTSLIHVLKYVATYVYNIIYIKSMCNLLCVNYIDTEGGKKTCCNAILRLAYK